MTEDTPANFREYVYGLMVIGEATTVKEFVDKHWPEKSTWEKNCIANSVYDSFNYLATWGMAEKFGDRKTGIRWRRLK